MGCAGPVVQRLWPGCAQRGGLVWAREVEAHRRVMVWHGGTVVPLLRQGFSGPQSIFAGPCACLPGLGCSERKLLPAVLLVAMAAVFRGVVLSSGGIMLGAISSARWFSG